MKTLTLLLLLVLGTTAAQNTQYKLVPLGQKQQHLYVPSEWNSKPSEACQQITALPANTEYVVYQYKVVPVGETPPVLSLAAMASQIVTGVDAVSGLIANAEHGSGGNNLFCITWANQVPAFIAETKYQYVNTTLKQNSTAAAGYFACGPPYLVAGSPLAVCVDNRNNRTGINVYYTIMAVVRQ